LQRDFSTQADEKTVAVLLACPIVCGVRRFGEIASEVGKCTRS